MSNSKKAMSITFHEIILPTLKINQIKDKIMTLRINLKTTEGNPSKSTQRPVEKKRKEKGLRDIIMVITSPEIDLLQYLFLLPYHSILFPSDSLLHTRISHAEIK